MNKSTFTPLLDGIDHINVYTKGNTELGRSLSNLAEIPVIASGIKYPSLEAFWYYTGITLALNYKNEWDPEIVKELEDLILSTKNPFDVRKACRQVIKELGLIKEFTQIKETNEFRNEITLAIYFKIQQTEGLVDQMISNKLPFTHYYFYGEIENNPKVILIPEYDWITEFLNNLPKFLRKDLPLYTTAKKFSSNFTNLNC